MRQRRPESKYSMQYDKLIIDHEIYMFNDMTGRVEEVSQSIQNLDFKNGNLIGDSQVTHLRIPLDTIVHLWNTLVVILAHVTFLKHFFDSFISLSTF